MSNSFFTQLWDKFFGDVENTTSENHKSSANSGSHPSDSWELDSEFFAAMSRWSIDNPETTLDRVLDIVCTGIENGESVLELIPDSPFPARGLVKALASLITLGNKVARAKREVYDFAKQILHWVSETKAAFENGKVRRGSFNWKTKRLLERRCNLIKEICTWATSRLDDNRWSDVGNGLRIGKEIEDFNARIDAARALFVDVSFFNVSQGLDEIIKGHLQIYREIKLVRKLQGKQLKEIIDKIDAQQQADDRRRFMDQMLQSYIVTNPTYDKQGKQPCDPDTRIEVLSQIDEWIHDFSSNAKSFLWLTGDPGSGKSAITASLAKKYKDTGILWAQFFINRNNVETTEPKSYFPSIARQLADHYPDSKVAVAIHDELKKKRSLVDDISAEQALGLFVHAIEAASRLDSEKPVLVVIDGLDESDRSRLGETAKIFSTLFKNLRCPNAKVCISSRTDDEIRKPFAQSYNTDLVKHIHLDTAAESSIQDVSTFIARRIRVIVEDNDLNWEEWPGEERLKALCLRASGLFIWAVTAIKFFQEQISTSGTEHLKLLLDTLSNKGMGDINVLYGTILHICYDNTEEWALETFRRVVGCIIILREPLCVGDIRDMLALRRDESSDPVDIINFVRRLRTVLVAGADAVDEKTIPRLHKSFFEFITSDRADLRFRVESSRSEGELATRCFDQLVRFRKEYVASEINPSAPECSVSGPLRYAVKFWGCHLPQMEGSASGLAVAIRGTRPPNIRDLLGGLDTLISWGKDVTGWDSVTGKQLRWPIQAETVTFSVAFSPDGTRIVSGGSNSTVMLWDARTGQAIGSALKGHTGTVRSVAFSPDGKRIASGSEDKTIMIWAAQTGQAIGSALVGHTEPVISIAFSPDGKRIVSGSDDNIVMLWDARTGQAVGSALKGHTGHVRSVAFSPDGARIVSGSFDNTIRLWDALTGQAIGSPMQGHKSYVHSIAFSPDGTRIASGSFDNTIRLWDALTGQAIGSPMHGHSGHVRSVAFSPDGARIVSGSFDNTIRLWDALTGQAIGSPMQGHTYRVYSVAFSSDGTRIVSGGRDIRLWDSQNGRPIASAFQIHTNWISSIFPFPDASRMSSVSLDGTVRIWSLRNGRQIGEPLISNLKGLISVAVATDGAQVAVATTAGAIYLWDVETRQLISQVECSVDGITSLKFSSHGSDLILARSDGSVSRWTAKDGKLVESSFPRDNRLPSANDSTSSFSMQRGWQSGKSDENILHRLPSEDPDAGLWAYVDGMLIRSNGPDSLSIFDVTRKSISIPIAVNTSESKHRRKKGKEGELNVER